MEYQKGDKVAFKNLLKIKFPFYDILPGETKTIELIGPDDIALRGVQLGHLIKVEVAGTVDAIAPPKPVVKKYTEKELYALSKAKQVEILKALGVKSILALEKERVSKILALQG